MLKIINISKSFGENKVLEDINFEVPKGKVVGLLGINGAGKTTLLRIINKIYLPNSGEVFWDGNPISEDWISKRTAYLPEERGLYPKMTVKENIRYFAEIRGMKVNKELEKKINDSLEEFSISEKANQKLEKLSKGMQQKIQIIASLLHNPDLIMLDEPFSGLDPINTQKLKEIFVKLSGEGKTIVFSSHRMEQVEEVCSEVVIINKGAVVVGGEIFDIKGKYKDNLFLIKVEGSLGEFDLQAKIVEKKDNQIKFRVKDLEDSNLILKNILKKYQVKEFREILPSIEDIFIKLVKTK